jgi:hypothetical protein
MMIVIVIIYLIGRPGIYLIGKYLLHYPVTKTKAYYVTNQIFSEKNRNVFN